MSYRILHETWRKKGSSGGQLDQTVAIALNDVNMRIRESLSRRVTASSLVNGLTARRRWIRGPREPRVPHVQILLLKAMRWQEELDAGEMPSLAAIARREGISRARVTQVMQLLKLPKEHRARILAMQPVVGRSSISERALRVPCVPT